MSATQAPRTAIGQGGRIFIFGFLSAIAPLSIDIYLPALPTMRTALAANEAQTLYTLSTFFIGFGGGQLLFGPLTDRFGRKRPLLCGLAVYIVASAGCALAPSIAMLVLFRFIQALGGSIVPITVQAMVRDLYARNESARILSLNLLVTASAPIVAPLIGGQLLLWLDWRFIFWALVAFGALAFIAALALPETLAAARRSQANPLTLVLGYVALLRDRRYVAVDVERGLVLGYTFFDHNGTVREWTLNDGRTRKATRTSPWTWEIVELFKIRNGKILRVEALVNQVPYGMKAGW